MMYQITYPTTKAYQDDRDFRRIMEGIPEVAYLRVHESTLQFYKKQFRALFYDVFGWIERHLD